MASTARESASIAHIPNRIPLSLHDPDCVVEVSVGAGFGPGAAVELRWLSELDGRTVIELTASETTRLVGQLLKWSAIARTA